MMLDKSFVEARIASLSALSSEIDLCLHDRLVLEELLYCYRSELEIINNSEVKK